MRQVIFKPLAIKAMVQLCDYVESKNTPGGGYRFQQKLLNFIELNAGIFIIEYPLCRNPKLARRNFSCLIFQGKWVIAFSYNQTAFIIHRIILGSKLK
jgi:hypothetical protein